MHLDAIHQAAQDHRRQLSDEAAAERLALQASSPRRPGRRLKFQAALELLRPSRARRASRA